MSCMAPEYNAKAVHWHVENNLCCERQKVKAEPSNQILQLRIEGENGLNKQNPRNEWQCVPNPYLD